MRNVKEFILVYLLLAGGGLPRLECAAPLDLAKLPPAATRPIDFAKDVLPIFNERCADCHGEKKQKSDYRLDRKDIALKGGESEKPAIVPGKSAESHLIQLVAGLEPDTVMPPKGEKLTAEQIGILRAWIDQGASWPEASAKSSPERHWAYVPPVKAPLPKVNDNQWVWNEIDRFVLAHLEKEGLKPSPEADRATLLRRLSLDLIGLPPSPAQMDAFLSDKNRDAYSAQIKKLLDSPHYGEVWGRHWLDAARYADSDGYEKDMSRDVWPYRDYVINALNKDVGYNQFIIDQLAGDLIPDHTQDQVVATGFLRNSMVNMEGAIDPEQFRMDAMFDRMDAIGKSVLGLTIQCCQCHNHKYDPFTQDDYYRMFAFLNDTHEANVAVYPPDQLRERAHILREIGQIEDDLKHRAPDWMERMAAWEDSVKDEQPQWTVVVPEPDISGGQKHNNLPDGLILAQGYAPTKHTTDFEVKTSVENITAI